MNLWETISERLLTRILDWVFGSLCVALLALHIGFKDKIALMLSQGRWLMVAEAFLFGILVLGYLFYKYWRNFRDKPKIKEYIFITDPPLYVYKKDKNNRSLHCYKCLFKVGHNQSRMGRILGRGLTCPNCNETFLEDAGYPGIVCNIIYELFNEEFKY
ncbi:hypothetical protein LLH00_05205 [bacterium]|nr:hypothetical protein [bacterium]